MARLRVGDIEIDGSEVRINGRVVAGSDGASSSSGTAVIVSETTTTTVSTSRGAIAPASPQQLMVRPSGMPPGGALAPTSQTNALATRGGGNDLMRKLPPTSAMVTTGGILAGLGALLVSLNLGALDPVSFLSSGGILLPLGIGVATLGLMKRGVLKRQAAEEGARLDAELAQCMSRMRGLLADSRPTQTVEWIVHSLGLPEATVLRALKRLRERGELVEELNEDTGDWYYHVAPTPTEDDDYQPAEAQDLDARLARLENRGPR